MTWRVGGLVSFCIRLHNTSALGTCPTADLFSLTIPINIIIFNLGCLIMFAACM